MGQDGVDSLNAICSLRDPHVNDEACQHKSFLSVQIISQTHQIKHRVQRGEVCFPKVFM